MQRRCRFSGYGGQAGAPFLPARRAGLSAPGGPPADYLIVEILLFAGRSVATQKALCAALYQGFAEELGIGPVDLETILVESPRHDWGIQGLPGDELTDLTYQVDR